MSHGADDVVHKAQRITRELEPGFEVEGSGRRSEEGARATGPALCPALSHLSGNRLYLNKHGLPDGEVSGSLVCTAAFLNPDASQGTLCFMKRAVFLHEFALRLPCILTSFLTLFSCTVIQFSLHS